MYTEIFVCISPMSILSMSLLELTLIASNSLAIITKDIPVSLLLKAQTLKYSRCNPTTIVIV